MSLDLTRREALAAGTSTLVLAGCAAPPALAPTRALAADEVPALLDRIAENLLWLKPEEATTLGIDEGSRAPLKSRLEDRSPAGRAALEARIAADLRSLDGVDPDTLDADTRTSVEVVRSAYATALEGMALPYGDATVGSWRNTPYVVIQNVGAYLDVPRFLDSSHTVETPADAEAYLARLESFAEQLDGETLRMRMAAEDEGLVPPDFLIDKALPQMRAARANMLAEDGTLVTSLARRADFAGDWAARAHAIAAQQVAPAMQRQIAEMERQRPLAASAPGIDARPHGSDFYGWALKAATTTTLSPDEIHQLGFDRLDEIYAEMDTILKGVGYTSGTVGERMKALGEDPDYLFPNTDAGREQLLAFLDERLEIIRAEMPNAFDTLAPGNVEIRRLPPEEEPGAPGAYGGAGSIDGSVPGKFWINLLDTSIHPKFSLPSLLHHEAIPGHVWQGEYANQLPLIRTLLAFGAYSEGWALYAEQLADELGVYKGNEVFKLGYLQSIAFRACRLVVDTGLHAKGWGRDQAVQWFHETNGNPIAEVAPEIDRYCSWPGQACSYEVGHIAINRERDRAKAEMGSAYRFKGFNDAVIKGGDVPMDVLAKNVSRYIAAG
ncbi:DUF885 domain-containing protein [Sphingomicrobium astaxanthinifaciens]|uniref:DUF885 domain-containing protein n=1 Tax=Sphingomicrobium astaxanthinifaciens TaxID=1227949 RepID=UPI001FCBBC9B|nr:DUF885 family protein [Sphingomicrobium astaxanthinifaciens]MCJ7422206.1 DUF885 family protein [Sphingomicrobium astaxanthinifaciens]